VAFDGRWRAEFQKLDDAIKYAREASDTGRMSWVVQTRFVGMFPKFVTGFPEDRQDEVEKAWHASKGGGAVGIPAGGP
jgi:hypothetical protein